jgi:single-strand DNA-binding protein
MGFRRNVLATNRRSDVRGCTPVPSTLNNVFNVVVVPASLDTPSSAPRTHNQKGNTNMSLNTTFLTGRLTKAPETRELQTGGTVTTINIAVKENVKADDEGKIPSQFFRISFFGRTAEVVEEKAVKGQLVTVTGRLRTNQRTIGREKVWTAEIIGTNIDLLTKPQSAQNTEPDVHDVVSAGEGN